MTGTQTETLSMSIARHPAARLAKDTSWTVLALGSRISLQAIYYVLLARALGPVGLGIFSGALAFMNLLVPFSGWGGGSLIVKYVARDRNSLPVYFANAVNTLALSGVLLSAIAVAIGPWFLGKGISHLLLVAVAISEMLALRFVEIVIQSFQAIDRMDMTARVQFLAGSLRLLAVVLYMSILKERSVMAFAGCYLVAAIAAAVVSRLMLHRLVGRLGGANLPRGILVRNLREGLPFSLSVASKSVYVDIDKTMLTRMVSPEVTGVYTAAYRLVSMAFAPIQAAVMSSNTRLFKKGAGGILPASLYAKRLLPYLILYAIGSGLILYLLAPLLPLLLGPSFRESVSVLRWLAFLPVIQSVHYLLGDTLMGAGFQGARSGCQVVVAGVNVVMNLFLIPLYSWKGAVWATFAAEGLLAIFLALLLAWHVSAERRRLLVHGALPVNDGGPAAGAARPTVEST